jgi:hypothetical protein
MLVQRYIDFERKKKHQCIICLFGQCTLLPPVIDQHLERKRVGRQCTLLPPVIRA